MKNAKFGIQMYIGAMGKPMFLTFGTREAFNQLRQVFTKAPILWHFDSECHIWIETDASCYAIGRVLSQLTSDHLTSDSDLISTKSDFGQWYPVVYFFRKIIPAEIWYKTHDGKLQAIVEAFKTWRHYLEGCKHEVFVLNDHNNLCRFMDIKSLSSKQVRWVQKRSHYHFWIDNCQGKANVAADILSCYPQRSPAKEKDLRAENTQIFHCLQSLLTNASLSGLTLLNSSLFSSLLPLHQVFICRTYVMPQLRQFWNMFRSELANEGLYKTSIRDMRLRLQELEQKNDFAQKARVDRLKEGWEEPDGVLHHQGLPYVPEIIRTKLISKHHDNPLAEHFGIKKTWELIARKYFWPSLRANVEAYVKRCDVYLALKAIRQKFYGDLHLLPIPTHQWKDLLMDFVTGLPVSVDWKGDSYNSILIIIDQLAKMGHYEPVKVTIDAPGLTEVIINVVVCHHDLSDSIVTNQGSFFTSRFWSSLCYFLGIKRRLSTAFHPQTDGQTKRQNSTMEAYLWAFINFEQNDWAKLLPIVKFAYNNAKNASTGHTPFKLNCGYHPCVSCKEDVDPRSKSKSADELSTDLRQLMTVYWENLHHAQELQKRAYDKGTKPRSYAPSDKVWLNSKYIKTKRNRKLESKFFGPFQVLHLVGKQVYKLELPKKWRIYDIFHVSLLELDTTKKERVDENAATQLEFEAGNNKKYEVEGIRDSVVYAKELEAEHLPELYYLVSWKGYPKEENIWEPALVVQHL